MLTKCIIVVKERERERERDFSMNDLKGIYRQVWNNFSCSILENNIGNILENR